MTRPAASTINCANWAADVAVISPCPTRPCTACRTRSACSVKSARCAGTSSCPDRMPAAVNNCRECGNVARAGAAHIETSPASGLAIGLKGDRSLRATYFINCRPRSSAGKTEFRPAAFDGHISVVNRSAWLMHQAGRLLRCRVAKRQEAPPYAHINTLILPLQFRHACPTGLIRGGAVALTGVRKGMERLVERDLTAVMPDASATRGNLPALVV